MKHRKDRLYKVLVIGATPSGIVATNKLGELGIPVTLVDNDPDLDQKLAREEWRLDSGLTFNFAHRAGLLRLLRNPLSRCIQPVEVVSLKHSPQGFRAILKKEQTFIDPTLCVLCGRCFEACPGVAPDGGKPLRFNGRSSLPGRPVIDKRKQSPCRIECPLGVNAQGYIALSRAGRFKEALDLVRQDNILPGICGRICTHPCEEACRRGELDGPIAIRDIKRFLADYELEHADESLNFDLPKRSEKIAVIGSGPAGLAASADLARLGYQVTIFEKEANAGGLLRYGIGAHRLPRDILDYELEYIKKLGVRIITSHPVNFSDGIHDLKKDFNAIIMTIGIQFDRMIGAPGEDLEGVEGCLSFLNRLHRDKSIKAGERVAVIGDGNAAFDLARTIRRLSADVTILSWFPEDLIPADQEEIDGAVEEGIEIMARVQVIEFSGPDGKLDSLRCKPTEPGEPDDKGIPWPVIIAEGDHFDLKFDRAIIAIGQAGSFKKDKAPEGLNVNDRGLVDVDDSLRTNIQGLYAAGDAVTGASSVVEAMASGRAAVSSLHQDIGGERVATGRTANPEDKDYPDIPENIPSLARSTMPERQPATRYNNFSEVALGLSKSQALFESERCLQCGVCSECLICTEACSLIGAINHQAETEEIIERAGVVIIADPKAVHPVKGEDVIRAYGPKAAKSDVYDMITRGFAAAANAMILLGETSLYPKGHSVSFPPPDPELSSDIRIGVFVCRCNNAFGWSQKMDEYIKRLAEQEEVVHAEVLLSACVPEGSAGILRMIREKDITRIVLGSCVCCPLDFVCNACTDQRSRLKDDLFKGAGVSRSMVETCNLRGEALRFLKDDPSTALNYFTGLLERSIRRVRLLKSLPAPARTYNLTTAVIGESIAALNSAQILAKSGFEVFMFGTPKKPLSEKLLDPNIHCFENSVVREMSGALGDFQLSIETGDFSQILQVGTVILGEKSRHLIPYTPQQGLQSSIVASSMQKRDQIGVPFLYPGTTSIAGLFLANPPGIRVSERKKGAAVAALAAAIMPRGPRQSRGYTVIVNEDRCRSCGRCIKVCPYQAITFKNNAMGGRCAVVDEALCKGCGNCISVCPSNAVDSPYRDRAYLEQLLKEVLVQ